MCACVVIWWFVWKGVPSSGNRARGERAFHSLLLIGGCGDQSQGGVLVSL